MLTFHKYDGIDGDAITGELWITGFAVLLTYTKLKFVIAAPESKAGLAISIKLLCVAVKLFATSAYNTNPPAAVSVDPADNPNRVAIKTPAPLAAIVTDGVLSPISVWPANRFVNPFPLKIPAPDRIVELTVNVFPNPPAPVTDKSPVAAIFPEISTV